jgi:signal transduction histidine kinase
MNKPNFEETMIHAANDTRRRQLTAIIAWGLALASLASLALIPAFADGETIYQVMQYPNDRQIAIASLVSLALALGTLLLLRLSKLAMLPGMVITSALFLILFFSDDFIEIAGGRSMIFLTVPVLIAAVVIHPRATFAAAAVSTTVLLLKPAEHIWNKNYYAMFAIWLLALSIWLATSIMEKAIEAAQLETRRVRAMLGIVSHELRTPLGSISGYLDLMMIGKSAGDAQFEMLSRVKDSARALIALVNRLLDSAHIQSGKLDLKPAATSVTNLFEPVIQAAEKQAKEKGLKFQADIHDLPDSILVDSLRLQQIIVNLLDNAVKYTGEGSVALEVAGLGNKMQIVVRDTGEGIAPENIRMIFQEFSQVQHYATRDQGGVGLGLYIVHSLVNLMGGSIRVESRMGNGSAFIVTLPLLISN